MKKKLDAAYGVIGLGRFGEALATMLAQSGNEVIAVDKDERKIREIRQYTDCAFVADNLSADTLKGNRNTKLRCCYYLHWRTGGCQRIDNHERHRDGECPGSLQKH